MKKLLLFLLLIPLAFAASWHELAALAVMVSAALLGVVYMIGFGFGINELQMMAREEFFQLIVLAVLVAVLTGSDSILNSISTLEPLKPGAADMQDATLDILQENREQVEGLLDDIASYDKQVSKQASKSSQCNLMSMGYSVSGCGGFSILAPPLSMAGGITAFALAELSAMERLVELASSYALALLLPIGILLRTFKITRGGGGFLIALGISLHLMLPIGIIFNEMLAETFQDSSEDHIDEYPPDGVSADIPECNPGDTKAPHLAVEIVTLGLGSLTDLGDSNEDQATSAYLNLRRSIRSHLFTILIKATLGPIIALLMMTSSIRALTHLAGAEVDVSAISRFI
ncbi:hypothetical protein GF318_01295 [Candidatus Micrarchaeota archaeon]|nr:hypothetical protein [Candidatus Micrarchaeota archaeon]